tara:strand:- start:554 stop:1432 length:879 start_codon:yes stop_codon:yes gene_type:complete
MNIYKKENSLFVVLITYILTIILTICITSTIGFNNEWMMILFAHSVATIGIYISSLIFNNSSMYDPFWSVAPIPIVIYLAYFSNNLVLNDLYTSLIVFVVLFWAVRLTHNWTMVWGGLKEEDFRYVDLKQGNLLKKEIVNFFGIHYIPTLQVNVSLLPLYFVFNENVINYNWILIGAIISICAVILQIVADKQMRDFKKIILNKNKIMNLGLWKYSRHPNYLGEVMFWIGLYVMALSVNDVPSWLVLSPLSMLVLFIFISCPMMDERSLKKRPGYKDYMDKTSQLLILPNSR